MFFLSEIEHKLQLPPRKLKLPLEEAIKGQLDSLFLDKVIAKLGLCISVYDIQSINGGFILSTEGEPTYTVVFRMIMFRPFVGEVISAKLKESTVDGLRYFEQQCLSDSSMTYTYLPIYCQALRKLRIIQKTEIKSDGCGYSMMEAIDMKTRKINFKYMKMMRSGFRFTKLIIRQFPLNSKKVQSHLPRWLLQGR